MKVEINLEHLQATTQEAVENDKHIKELVVQRKEKERRLTEAKHRILAQGIIDNLPNQCLMEARIGRCSTRVMRLRPERDYEVADLYYVISHPTELRGVAALVWDACQETELECQLAYGHDGIGVRSWIDMKVSW
jgi:hypothetical protein